MTSNATKNVTKDADAIFHDGVLIDLQIGFWSARAANRPTDLGLHGGRRNLPDFVAGLGTKRLTDKHLIDHWVNLAARARYAVKKRSFPFPVADTRFVPLTSLDAVEKELTEIRREFMESVEYLIRHYDTIRETVLSKSDRHRRALASHYPRKSELRGKFYMSWTPFTIQMPRKLRVEATKRSKLSLREKAQERYRAELEQRMGEFLNETVGTLREKTTDLCEKVVAKIKAGEVVTNRSLNTLRSFIDQFKQLNFVGDKEVEAKLDKLKRDVLDGRDADAFAGNDVSRARLAQALTDVQSVAESVSDISTVTGTYKRKIAL